MSEQPLQVKASMKEGFFDRQAVIDAIGPAKARALSKAAAFVRRRAQTSLRYRKTISPAGTPPSAHRFGGFTRFKTNKKTGITARQPVSPLRELIQFAYDSQADGFIVGPEIFRSSVIGGGIATEALEYGGSSLSVTPVRGRAVRHPVVIRARPFMRPALSAESKNFAPLFRNQVRPVR